MKASPLDCHQLPFRAVPFGAADQRLEFRKRHPTGNTRDIQRGSVIHFVQLFSSFMAVSEIGQRSNPDPCGVHSRCF